MANDLQNVQARLTAMSKTITRLRNVLILVTDNIEDDGDRAYFGSSNDADTLKDVVEDLDGWHWDDIVSDGELPDVYEKIRHANARANSAEAKLSAVKEALFGMCVVYENNLNNHDEGEDYDNYVNSCRLLNKDPLI